MQSKRLYSLTKGKLRRAYKSGLELQEDGSLVKNSDQDGLLILRRFKSYEGENRWGRLFMDAQIDENCALVIRAFAINDSNDMSLQINKAIWDDTSMIEDTSIEELQDKLFDEEVSKENKLEIFMQPGAKQWIDMNDILLYDLEGTYLFVAISIIGEGRGTIRNIRLDTMGDNFMQTFPEIYHDEAGFFHRYMSIFSSIYNDLQYEVDHVYEYLDLDTTPAKLLPYFSRWLGFEIDKDFLDENCIRSLLKEMYQLNKMKGTSWCLKRLVRIIAGCDCHIMECSYLQDYKRKKDVAIYERLYGDDVNTITIILSIKSDELLHNQLKYILNQFKPVRSSLKFVFAEEENRLDEYCYLDVNAALSDFRTARLDMVVPCNGLYTLK